MTGGRRKVAVLMGGWSAERQVSLSSGRAVMEALERLGHKVIPIDVDRDIAARLREAEPDIAFNALHGRWGEDGALQGVLEILNIPYTHSGVRASAVAMDKVMTKRLCGGLGVDLATHKLVNRKTLFAADPLPRPFVVKPVAEGSSVGVAIVEKDGKYPTPLSPDIAGPWDDFDTLMVEEFIPGRELSVAVLDGEALGVVELKPSRGFYDYEAKYTDGITRHLMPAPIHPAAYDAAMKMARDIHLTLGCRGVSRTDFRYDDSKGEPGRLVLLEINTQPGMTPLSLVPEIAGHSGIGFDELIERILDDAGIDK